MSIKNYTYKFRLKPTEEQKILLDKHFGSVRWTYNHFLNERKDYYLQNKRGLNYYNNANSLAQLKKVFWMPFVGT